MQTSPTRTGLHENQPAGPADAVRPGLTSGAGRLPPRSTVLDGHLLKEARRAGGLSRERLAGRAGLALTTITRLESRASAPCRIRTLVRLAAALGEHPGAIAPVHRLAPSGAPAGQNRHEQT